MSPGIKKNYPNSQLIETLSPSEARLHRALERHLGLAFPEARTAELREGLRRVCQRLGCTSSEDLVSRLAAPGKAQPAWDVVGQELVNPESFFMRDAGQMDALRDVLTLGLQASIQSGHPFRIWSAGCSRGEEAYSLAMVAREILPAEREIPIHILGTDINTAALEQARNGWYGSWSLRGLDPARKQRWFTAEGDGYRISPELGRNVAFRSHNLAGDDPGGLTDGQGFDLILCRNVFIYFRPERVPEVLQRFRTVLNPGGTLMLGHGEWGPHPPEGWRVETHPHTALLHPVEAPPPPPAPPPLPWMALREPAVLPAPPVLAHPRPRPSTAVESIEEGIHALRTLGDRGQWDEALALGARCLKHHPLSAELHYALSQVLAARGEAGAALAMLEKTLYLDPSHLAAQMDQARYFESRGRQKAAARAWKAVLRTAEAHPEDLSLADLGADTPEALRDLLQKAMQRCLERAGARTP